MLADMQAAKINRDIVRDVIVRHVRTLVGLGVELPGELAALIRADDQATEAFKLAVDNHRRTETDG